METKTLDENLHSIDLMGEFEQDWNGNGALTFPEDSLDTFRKVLKSTSVQPYCLSPTGRRSLVLTFDRGNEEYMDFEIFRDKVTFVFIKNNDYKNAVIEHNNTDVVGFVCGKVDWFYNMKS